MKMAKLHLFPFLCLMVFLAASCSSTKHLAEGEYMLARNNVVVKDAKNPDFDDLKSYVRPIPNKKFMDMINVRTMIYSMGHPKYKKNGTWKDSKFRRLLRERLGEAPVLVDTSEIENSLKQLNTVMSQLGYFDSETSYEIVHRKIDPKKVKVNYSVQANEPFFIRQITYDIDVPEYKRIIVLHKDESLLSEGMQYNENKITDEFTRIINVLRDEGYYYVEKSIIRGEVSYDPPSDSTQKDPHTVSLTIILRLPSGVNTSRYLYKYYFNKVYVQTNYEPNAPPDLRLDTVKFRNYKSKFDTTTYYFLTPHYDDLRQPIQDFHYRTITDAIFTNEGLPYTQNAKRLSNQALNQLDNFSYYTITYVEADSLLDTLHKKGYLDVLYRLTRKKVHSVGGQLDLRNDKSAISFTYANRNLFKGGEHLAVNLSGGYFYYSLPNLFNRDNYYTYPEFGVNVSLTFPKLLFFGKYHKGNTIKRSTSIKFGVNYSGLYYKLLYNAALTYNWSPSYYVNHSLSPIDISTQNNSDRWYTGILNFYDYSPKYQKKFGKYIMLSTKYNFDYLVPFSSEARNHNMRLSLNVESSGLLLKGLNAIFDRDHRWVLARGLLDGEGYNYTTFEKVEFTLNYAYKINNNNTLALRLNAGAMVPLDSNSYIPFERGFSMGTSNSMRGWGYRGLGPGSYEHGKDSLFTGDVKLEWNIEYRGTIYRSFKYGVFVDAGNIWLTRNINDMEGATFKFNRFYKEIAMNAGVGLRLDFDFLIIRVDFALPIYDPTRTSYGGRWINKEWFDDPRPIKLSHSIKFAIGYAF